MEEETRQEIESKIVELQSQLKKNSSDSIMVMGQFTAIKHRLDQMNVFDTITKAKIVGLAEILKE